MKVSVALNFLLLLLAACGAAEQAAPGAEELVVERASEDGVEVVRNISGSVWGAPAHLEEELSIGVLEGAEQYMFGNVVALWATDERVYVVDGQLPTVRVYDRSGAHLLDIGQGGEGPGEFERPRELQVLRDGTVAVVDTGKRRIVFFSPDGDHVGSWTAEQNFGSRAFALADGRLLLGRYLPPENPEELAAIPQRAEVVEVHPDGSTGPARAVPAFDRLVSEILIRAGEGVMMMSGTFLGQPDLSWTVRPDGALVAGVGEEFDFEIRHQDGRRTRVERYWEPAPVEAAAVDYLIRRVEAQLRSMDPEYTWDGPEAEENWPAYSSIVADRNNRMWLLRRVGSRRMTDCVEDPYEDVRGAARRPCWRPEYVFDAFAPDGAYLGQLDRPDEVSLQVAFIDGDEYWAAVEDEDGVVRVKRYRIVTDESRSRS